MAPFQLPARRLILAGGFAVAIAAAPAVAVFAGPSTGSAAPTVVACPAGEEADLYTGACHPLLTPGFGGAGAGGYSAPTEQELTDCSGRRGDRCGGQQFYPTPSVPNVSTEVQQSQ